MFRVAAAAAIGRERVHQRDTWLRAILDNTPSAVVLKDLDLRIMAVSRKDAAEHGLTPDQVVGKTTRDLFPADIAAIYEAADRKVIAAGQTSVRTWSRSRTASSATSRTSSSRCAARTGASSACATSPATSPT